jgi:hypothetical protein
VNPTRFPNPQTEVQADSQVFVYACEAICRPLTDRREREQLRPKLRPKVGKADLVSGVDRLQLLLHHDPHFRRNRQRVARDAERERLIVEWDLGYEEPETA